MSGELIRFPIKNSNSNLFIEGNLAIPDYPIGIIVFVHGSGSSKSSHRNRFVSEKLNEYHVATLLFDLLSNEEQESDKKVENMISQIPGAVLNKFNLSLLTKRLLVATDWIMNYPSTAKLPIGYYASSTGSGAALIVAAKYHVRSIVIRSGRTDLVDNHILDQIVSPCLFIVGSKEKALMNINKGTIKKLRNVKEKQIIIVDNASHMFEEEGCLEKAVDVSTKWIKQHFE